MEIPDHIKLPAGTVLHEKTGTPLFPVPGGDFIAGGPGEWEGGAGRLSVSLNAFYIAIHPVTNEQYKAFIDATGHQAPDIADWDVPVWRGSEYTPELHDHPVVCVDWNDARTYCEWAGLRLPTELEWEKAARGIDGRTYPWGDEWDSGRRCRCNGHLDSGGTAGVWEFPNGASQWGILQMAGNVYEWCEDWYDPDAHRRYRIGDHSLPLKGEYKICRGGSWDNRNPHNFTCSRRSYNLPSARLNTIGFRCALD